METILQLFIPCGRIMRGSTSALIVWTYYYSDLQLFNISILLICCSNNEQLHTTAACMHIL